MLFLSSPHANSLVGSTLCVASKQHRASLVDELGLVPLPHHMYPSMIASMESLLSSHLLPWALNRIVVHAVSSPWLRSISKGPSSLAPVASSSSVVILVVSCPEHPIACHGLERTQHVAQQVTTPGRNERNDRIEVYVPKEASCPCIAEFPPMNPEECAPSLRVGAADRAIVLHGTRRSLGRFHLGECLLQSGWFQDRKLEQLPSLHAALLAEAKEKRKRNNVFASICYTVDVCGFGLANQAFRRSIGVQWDHPRVDADTRCHQPVRSNSARHCDRS